MLLFNCSWRFCGGCCWTPFDWWSESCNLFLRFLVRFFRYWEIFSSQSFWNDDRSNLAIWMTRIWRIRSFNWFLTWCFNRSCFVRFHFQRNVGSFNWTPRTEINVWLLETFLRLQAKKTEVISLGSMRVEENFVISFGCYVMQTCPTWQGKAERERGLMIHTVELDDDSLNRFSTSQNSGI